MCLAQQNSDGEESHDGLTDEKSTQIAADAVDGEGKQHKEDADAAGNQIQHESDARVAEPCRILLSVTPRYRKGQIQPSVRINVPASAFPKSTFPIK